MPVVATHHLVGRCVDDDGLVHDMKTSTDTWCGWNRTWVGGEWKKVPDDTVVTCLECWAASMR